MAWFRQRPVWVADGVLAAIVFVVEASSLWVLTPEQLENAGYTGPTVTAVLIQALLTLPLAWRRIRPGPVLTIVGLTAITQITLEVPATGLSLVIALYTVAAYRPRGETMIELLVFLGVMMVALALDRSVSAAAVNALIFVTAWALGDRSQVARQRAETLERRTRELEVEREHSARLGAQRERTRIAREFHDIAAHGVAVIAVQASGARRVLHHDPARAEQALAAIEDTARSSLVEIRRAVSLLRDEQQTATPQPGLGDLADLLDRFRDAGLRIVDAVPEASVALGPAVGLTVYRIVQEALTNVLTHVGPTRANVRVAVGEGHVRVVVADDGLHDVRGGHADRPVAHHAPATSASTGAGSGTGGGYGLVGLRERVGALGGTLHSGPRRRGHLVDARIPLDAPVGPAGTASSTPTARITDGSTVDETLS